MSMDPSQFGEMRATVQQLQEEVKDLKKDVKELLAMANKGRGGLWAGMTFVSIFSAAVSWAAQHFIFK